MMQPVDQSAGQVAFAHLRTWIAEHCGAGDQVRQSGYGMALSSHVHRLIKFGPDRSLDHLTARDLLNILIYINGSAAEWLMRSAFTRALIEGDMAVVDHLMTTCFMPEVRGWYHRLVAGLLGQVEDTAAQEEWLHAMESEQKAIARLVTMRLYPDTATISWLHEAPEHPQLQAAMAAVLGLAKPELQGAVEAFVRERPGVRNWLL